MCRVFGFRSVILSQVHRSLVSADNALGVQSADHPDGWGVAYYVAGAPHIVKSEAAAIEDSLFKKVSGIVSSETVVAHIRKATEGKKTILNTHPFQYGSWVFAHNGHIPDFAKHKSTIKELILPRFRRFILGETDSEWIFYLILSHLHGYVSVEQRGIPLNTLAVAVKNAMAQLREKIGEFSQEDVEGDLTRNYLTFVLTNGELMVGHQGGKQLFYSTYKTACGERKTCPSYAFECENKTVSGYVNHLIFSSEPLLGENIWLKMTPGDLVGVDWSMKLGQFSSL